MNSCRKPQSRKSLIARYFIAPATCNLEPATCNLKPGACDLRWTAIYGHSASCNLQLDKERSATRMLNKAVQSAINDQIKEEFYSAYLYLAMSGYCETINLPGFAHSPPTATVHGEVRKVLAAREGSALPVPNS